MKKLKMHTPDLTEEKFKKLVEMFPNAVTETVNENDEVVRAIDADVLRQEISAYVVEGAKERYQFTWPDKKKSVILSNQPIARTLRLNRDKSVGRDGTDGSIDTDNVYIEGDNLEALKLLQETYLGKIKMIYIDPPYNTGSDAFVYDDDSSISMEEFFERSGQRDEDDNLLFDFRQNNESNGRFHTDWLNMMYPRLRLAKDLLSEDGVIFISIDDNEQENLKKMCDEVFGAINFVGKITIVSNPSGRDYRGVARMHDYLYVYKKTQRATINLIKDEENPFTMFDKYGGFELRELRNRNIKFNKENRPNLYYPFFIDPNDVDEHGLHTISLEEKKGWIKLYPLESQGVNTVWRWGKIRAKENLNINIKAKPMRNGSYMIVEKYRESRMMARSVWWDKEINTEKGTLLIKEIMEGKVFDYPKPLKLLTRILEMGTIADENNIVLDFFSGSATTAHAVIHLNAEDGGNRKFIMIQEKEPCNEGSDAYRAGYKNICEIGEERIRRSGKKIKEGSPLTTNDLDIGFRVFRVASSNMKDVYYSPAEFKQEQIELYSDNIKSDRTPEDLLFQVMLDLGIPLSSEIEVKKIDGKEVFSVDGGYLIACFDSNIKEKTVIEIAKQKPFYAVFRDSSMANDSVITNFEQVFETYSPDTQRKVL